VNDFKLWKESGTFKKDIPRRRDLVQQRVLCKALTRVIDND